MQETEKSLTDIYDEIHSVREFESEQLMNYERSEIITLSLIIMFIIWLRSKLR